MNANVKQSSHSPRSLNHLGKEVWLLFFAFVLICCPFVSCDLAGSYQASRVVNNDAVIVNDNANSIDDVETQTIINSIITKVEKIRGLTTSLSEVNTITDNEWMLFLDDLFAKEYTLQKSLLDQAEWELLGLISPGQNLRDLRYQLLSGEVLGFYDSDTDQMSVLDRAPPDSGLFKMVVAHEYAHALQDARFGLKETDDLTGGENLDLQLAYTAFVEGDASITGLKAFEALATHRDRNDLRRSAGKTEYPGLHTTEYYLKELFDFPYKHGVPFVETLLERGGWDRVDLAYNNVPVSTEQILHPQKYLKYENPVSVEIPDFSPYLPSNWTESRRNTMGEFWLELIFNKGHLKKGVGGEGWGGDQYVIYSAEGNNLMVLKTVWDTVSDHEEFLEILASEFAVEVRSVHQSHGDLSRVRKRGDWSDREKTGVIIDDGSVIYLVIGTDSDAVMSIVSAI